MRRLNVTVNGVVPAAKVQTESVQLDLFADPDEVNRECEERQSKLDKEHRLQEAQVAVKRRFGKNAVLKGLNFEEGATAKDRNKQIGGHKA